jgi:putative peptidoglycan binding protein
VTGSDLVKLALGHVGERYVLGITVPKDNPNWHAGFDCAELCSYLVYQATGKLYGCTGSEPATADAYTGFWARDAEAIGLKVSVETAARTPGAFVLRVPMRTKLGHIILSMGDGRTVEAHSTARGVIIGELGGRRWDVGVFVPGIEVEAGPGPVVVGPVLGRVYRVTTPRMRGAVVLALQQALEVLGFDPGPIDGIFGHWTAAAVAAFQARGGLAVDGECGPLTLAALGIGGHP